MFTLTALRRRGFPPEAINKFCGKVLSVLLPCFQGARIDKDGGVFVDKFLGINCKVVRKFVGLDHSFLKPLLPLAESEVT